MFIGRENELDTLNRLYHSDKFEFTCVVKKRRWNVNKNLQTQILTC